jgi:hypothetical protein
MAANIIPKGARLKPFPVPVVRAESLIPHGDYCYTPEEAPSAENGWVYKVRTCPFLQFLPDKPPQLDGWCDYLKAGDFEENGTSLLFDSVKECGVNQPREAPSE